jgi:hypothetical protein
MKEDTMQQVLIWLFLLALAGLAIYIFKVGYRANNYKEGAEKHNSKSNCMGCQARRFCNDVKQFEAIADEVSCKNKAKLG